MDYRDRIENIKDIPLNEFSVGDTLYISKMESGFQVIYFCKFIGIKRGIVQAEVINSERYGKFKIGDTITARPSNCFLWGNTNNETLGKDHLWIRCHWFKNVREPVE